MRVTIKIARIPEKEKTLKKETRYVITG